MGFFSEYFKTLLDKWLIPLVLVFAGLVGPSIYRWFTRENKSNKPMNKFITYAAGVFVIFVLVTTLILTLIDAHKNSSPDINRDISIEDITFESGNRGLASLYDSEMIPYWYEDDSADICLELEVDNSGTSHVSIEKAKLIIDDFTPVTTDDILIFRLEGYQGEPDTAKAKKNLYDISPGRSEHDITFSSYLYSNTGHESPIQQGHTFYADPSSKLCLNTTLALNRTGVYTYHFEMVVKYYKEESLIKTAPETFIYIGGKYEDYKYNAAKLGSFFMDGECISDDSSQSINYSIKGRTLRIHDTKTIFYNMGIGQFYALIDTVIVEDGTEEIEAGAFQYANLGYFATKTLYLPKTLKSLEFECFYNINRGNLKRVCFGGTKEEWDALERNSDSYWKELGNNPLEGVDIIYNSDISTFEDEVSNTPVDDRGLFYNENTDRWEYTGRSSELP